MCLKMSVTKRELLEGETEKGPAGKTFGFTFVVDGRVSGGGIRRSR